MRAFARTSRLGSAWLVAARSETCSAPSEMNAPNVLLTHFQSTRPRCEVTQAHSLRWLTAAHAASESTLQSLDDSEKTSFEARISKLLQHCGVRPNKVARRGAAILDIASTRWNEQELYDLTVHPHGKGSADRSRIYSEVVDAYFANSYANETAIPDDLIHVTCTGYVSPSGAQKLVAQRGWGSQTRVSHAYHMGCYAALPAIRMAAAYISNESPKPWRCDIVHTELCSLHIDPSDHRAEQLVVQSLFADGFIRYTTRLDDGSPGMRLRSLCQLLVPNSSQAMTWSMADWGMQITLARDVADRIAQVLPDFMAKLYDCAGYTAQHIASSTFAVHPGGPKIVDRVREVLKLDPAQLSASSRVLFDHGNMSSATLPHIWMRLMEDPDVPRGSLIPSLAFGPGLTVCGALFEKA